MNLSFYAETEDGNRFVFSSSAVCDGGKIATRYTLCQKTLSSLSKIRIFSPDLHACAGEDGWFLLPQNRNMSGSVLTFFTPRADCALSVSESMMALFAARVGGRTYLVEIARNYRYLLSGSCRNGLYQLTLSVDLTDQPVKDDFVLTLFDLADADENGVAKAERDLRLARKEIAPLAEKCAERKILDYNCQHPLIRIRMGWKPAPPEILHQTPENEPPMHVACTFAQVRKIADALKAAGVNGAEISLVGWNQKGHDGRWPQIFPVEEALGGETELCKTIAHVRSLGYTITCHTNCLDHYEIAENFDPDTLVRKKDGSLLQNGKWSGGAAYRACPKMQITQAKRDLPHVAALGFQGLHYIDVLSTILPDVCFAQAHPCTLREAIASMRTIMQLSHTLFGGFSSEGGMDFSLSELDFSLYQTFAAYQAPPCGFADRYFPLWELTYHGIVLYNPSSTTVNYGLKTPDDAVTVALYGGRPTFYYYSRFCTGQNARNWMGETDLTCDTPEELANGVAAIKRAQDAYEPFARLQKVYMHSYRVLANGLREICYENHARVLGNYTDLPLADDKTDTIVDAHSYRLLWEETVQ